MLTLLSTFAYRSALLSCRSCYCFLHVVTRSTNRAASGGLTPPSRTPGAFVHGITFPYPRAFQQRGIIFEYLHFMYVQTDGPANNVPEKKAAGAVEGTSRGWMRAMSPCYSE